MPGSQAPDEQWEYEYDATETEVFLVDLDLTTVNRPIKSVSESRHKRLKDIEKPGAKRRKLAANTSKDETPQDDAQSPQIVDDPGSPDSAIPQATGNRSDGPGTVQILEIDTANPIVSYQGRIYSCNWTDMLGTTMFFNKPQASTLLDPQMSTNEFDLLGTSRIKLVGTAAKVTPNQQNDSDKQPDRPGQSLGTIRSSNAKTNADLRKQANFLDQLMSVKKNRGELDNVRVAMNEKISAAVRSGRSMPTPAQRKEIDELNRRVVKGDAAALRKLEQLILASKNDRLPSPQGNPYGVQLPVNGAAVPDNNPHRAQLNVRDSTDHRNLTETRNPAEHLDPTTGPASQPMTTIDASGPSSYSIYPEFHVPISNPENLDNDNG